jgi:hypothetical protein
MGDDDGHEPGAPERHVEAVDLVEERHCRGQDR